MYRVVTTMALAAFLSNAVLHVAVLCGWIHTSLSRTWPAHLLSMILFLAMMWALFTGTLRLGTQLSRMNPEERTEYGRRCQRDAFQKSTWSRLFGDTPGWVGVVVVTLFAYSFGSFAYDGLQQPGQIVERDGEFWFYDDDDGWIRRATEQDRERARRAELRFATAAFALFGFVPWAYFSVTGRRRRSEPERAGDGGSRPGKAGQIAPDRHAGR